MWSSVGPKFVSACDTQRDPVAWAIIPKFVAEGVINLVDGKNVFGDEHQACMGATFAREEVVPLYYQGTEAIQFWHERQDGKGVTKYDEVYWYFYGVNEDTGQEDWTLHGMSELANV